MKIMPPNGSWVRIIIENGNLSCAAKVFRRTTTKKATLLFWDEQHKFKHKKMSTHEQDILKDEPEM